MRHTRPGCLGSTALVYRAASGAHGSPWQAPCTGGAEVPPGAPAAAGYARLQALERDMGMRSLWIYLLVILGTALVYESIHAPADASVIT